MLTHAEVQVSQPELDFGEVAVSDAVMLRQTVTNLSELPCRIGFLKLPRGVSMKPALGASLYLLYWYKSTNADANAPAGHVLASPPLRVTLALLVQKYKY
jgi:hypothetical protein